MHILYDHQIFTRQLYGGISRYFCELMDQYAWSQDVRFTIALRASYNENLRNRSSLSPYWSDRSNFLSNSRIIPLIQKNLHINLLKRLHINQSESERLLREKAFDIFHPTDYNPYFLKRLQKKPLVITIHDMIHERCPEYYSARDPTARWKRDLIERADAIIAVSENTKKDLLEFTDARPDSISVIYHGNPFENKEFALTTATRPVPFPVQSPYILFVGSRTRYKNFHFFISAIANLLKKKKTLTILCAGGGPFTDHEKKLIQNLGISSQIRVVDANENTMAQWYANARVFVFPSLYEGFGLPVLEAFSCGCPVVASDTSSLPEIGCDAACYFNPRDPTSLLNVLEPVLTDEEVRKEIIAKGFSRARDFSWTTTAEKTKAVYAGMMKYR
jgi:glycosyltransferase involved in cell wall biosynthesis